MRAVIILLLLSGCAGTMYNAINTDAGCVTVGMSVDQAMAMLGPPAMANSYPSFEYLYSFPGGLMPATNTIEFVWKKNGKTLVAYCDHGRVSKLGLVGK
jgi:hypothetical protein